MIKRLIFDIDGTLITGIDFKVFVKNALQKFNIYSEQNVEKFLFAIKKYESYFDHYSKSDYLDFFSSELNTKLNDDFLRIFFDELKFAVPKENDELLRILEELSTKYELVLLSNYFQESQMNRLNNMRIGHLFTEYHGEKITKPNRQAYYNACGNNKPSECIMIGDDPILDIEGAKNNGLHTIFINPKRIIFPNSIHLESVKCLNDKIIYESLENSPDQES